MGPIYTSSTAALRRAFDIFDADGNGSIDRDEFSSIMHRLHLLPRDDEAAAEKALAQMFDVADIDHDGTASGGSGATQARRASYSSVVTIMTFHNHCIQIIQS